MSEPGDEYRIARRVALAMQLRGQIGQEAMYVLPAHQTAILGIGCFSFDVPRTGVMIESVQLGLQKVTCHSWIDAFHTLNFSKARDDYGVDYPVLDSGVDLSVKVLLPCLRPNYAPPEDWESWRMTCWGTLLERIERGAPLR